jgi:hypothetical protein
MSELRELHLRGATGAVRMASLHDVEHLVVPVVALMEGVIHAVNADVPEYVPIETLSAAPQLWNNRPAVLKHPVRNGRQISANIPHVLEAQSLGSVFNAAIRGNKLVMDAYIDPARAEKLGAGDMVRRLRAGESVEVSVGAFVTTAAEIGEHNGKKYKARWQQIHPDHLAFLPDGIGACSVKMGCGTRAAESYLVTAEGFEDINPKHAHVITDLGGAGSGNFGHAGIPGQVGGSSAGSAESHDAAGKAHRDAASAHMKAARGDYMHGDAAKAASDAASKASSAAGHYSDHAEKADVHAETAHNSYNGAATIKQAHYDAASAHRAAAREHEAKGSRNGSKSDKGPQQKMHEDAAKLHKDAHEAHIAAARAHDDVLHAVGTAKDAQAATKVASRASGSANRASEETGGFYSNSHIGTANATIASSRGQHAEARNAHEKAANSHSWMHSSHRDDAAGAKTRHAGEGTHHSAKWHRCWDKVQAQGHDSSSAAAICTAALEEESYEGREAEMGTKKRGLAARLKSFIESLRAAQPGDTPSEAASEEAAELVGYKTMQTMFEQLQSSLYSAASTVEELIADETENPTETPADEEAEEEVETARLESIQSLCMTMFGSLNAVMSVSNSLLTPDADDVAGNPARYMAGARNSKADKKVIQQVHDHSVTLGAECSDMKAAGEKPCGCREETMTKDTRTAAIKQIAETESSGFTKDDVKTLEAMNDKQIEGLKSLIDAKAAADKSAADLKAAEEKKAADEKKDTELRAAEEQKKPPTVEEYLKSAPAEIRTLVERQKKHDSERKTVLLTQLKTAQAEYTEDELKSMDVEQLERLARVAKIEAPADYRGRGVVRAAEENDVFTNPPDPYAPGLKALREGNSSKVQ